MSMMLKMMNLTGCAEDLDRYADGEDLRAFLDEHGLDGLEFMPLEGGGLPGAPVLGVHLGYFPYWVDFWRGDEAAVVREFGSLKVACAQYAGADRGALVRRLRAELDLAARLGARYVVFHVSDVSIEESVSYRFAHSDEVVVEAALEWICAALKGRADSFEFLVENLWWPGFTMTRPEVTAALLCGIPARRKGIMLDTGHLMHTELSLKTEREAVDYILRRLEAHGPLAQAVRGLHLNQSLTGAHVRAMRERNLRPEGSYRERLGAAYEQILQIDRHEPFESAQARRLVERIGPEYLTHEFITGSRAQHTRYLQTQCRALRDLTDLAQEGRE